MELAFKRNPRQGALLHGLYKDHVFRLITTKTIMEGSFSRCHNPGRGSRVSLANFLIGSPGADRADSRYPLALGVSITFGPNFSTCKNTLVKIGEIVATFSSNICEVWVGMVSPGKIIISRWQTS